MLDVLLNVASFAGGALIALLIARKDSEHLRKVAQDLQSHNEEVASATRVEFKRSMRAAGIRVPPQSEEAIEVEFHGSGGGTHYNWPKETWRVKQGDWSAYTDDWPTMIELVRYLTGEIIAGYPDDSDYDAFVAAQLQMPLFQMGLKLRPDNEEFWKGVHVLDEGS
jgi:hypothetical protein